MFLTYNFVVENHFRRNPLIAEKFFDNWKLPQSYNLYIPNKKQKLLPWKLIAFYIIDESNSEQ